jgi:uncharacterized protein
MTKKKVIIFGASGFLGMKLAEFLKQKNYEVIMISRHQAEPKGLGKFCCWDAQNLGAWVEEMEGAEAIINLVGRSVDCVKSAENCDAILRSRVQSTTLIGKALKNLKELPKAWVQMSTAHIYGDSETNVCTEDSPYGYGLAPFVGQAWEKAFHESAIEGMRKVVLRTSFVLGASGGALPRLAKIAKWGLGGKVGHGKQGISWLHEDDMNRIFLRAIEDVSMQGTYIASSPQPVSNTEFMKSLRKALGIRIGLPAPACLVKLAAPIIMSTDPDLALYGRYCQAQKLIDEGFEFNYPNLNMALSRLYA